MQLPQDKNTGDNIVPQGTIFTIQGNSGAIHLALVQVDGYCGQIIDLGEMNRWNSRKIELKRFYETTHGNIYGTTEKALLEALDYDKSGVEYYGSAHFGDIINALVKNQGGEK